MPIYEFVCRGCETRFEAIRPLGDDGRELACPSCGKKAPEKVPAVFSASCGCRASTARGSGFG